MAERPGTPPNAHGPGAEYRGEWAGQRHKLSYTHHSGANADKTGITSGYVRTLRKRGQYTAPLGTLKRQM
jgi:hypothetical protein